MKWLERSLPLCASSVIPGGTHAFVYDKRNMEEVFSTLQKSITQARVSLETRKKKKKVKRRGSRRLPAYQCLRDQNPNASGVGRVLFSSAIVM